MLSDLNKAIFDRRRRRLLTIPALSRQIFKTRAARAPVVRRFWTRPGRTSAWWDNFTSQTVVEEEWKENFRMSRPTFLLLCEELRPFVQKKATNMRLSMDVKRQVASTLYYLSDEGRIRKTANAFGLSRSVISNIIRRICIAITVHLGSKYIKLPFTEAEVKELVSKFYKRFSQNTVSV